MPDCAALKALVVEDEGAVALLIEDMLDELGYEVAASSAEVGEACEIARTLQFDFALLDLNLAGSSALPVADILRERRIPFLFSTGYGVSGLPQEWRCYPALVKPFVLAELAEKVRLALEMRPDPPPPAAGC